MAKIKDKLTGEAADEAVEATPVVSTVTSTEEDASVPPVAKAKANEPVMATYLVHCPNDPCLPSREVEAQTPADAKEKYMEQMGIIVCGHPLNVAEV